MAAPWEAKGCSSNGRRKVWSYWHLVPFLVAFLFGIAYINSRRFVLGNVRLYWCGIVVFAIGTTLAAGYHVGWRADAWGLVAVAGWLIIGLSAWGWPPRRPTKRPGWF
jgi:hypothetical protein